MVVFIISAGVFDYLGIAYRKAFNRAFDYRYVKLRRNAEIIQLTFDPVGVSDRPGAIHSTVGIVIRKPGPCAVDINPRYSLGHIVYVAVFHFYGVARIIIAINKTAVNISVTAGILNNFNIAYFKTFNRRFGNGNIVGIGYT